MEFRILGPVEVWQGGVALPISAPRQLAVLAGLLTRRGSAVPIDTIIDDLWGADPPRSAGVTVRNYVQRLRRILPEPVLDSDRSGYRLRFSPDQLDVHRFESLASAARAARDPHRAAELFDQALRLWRGAPLSGIGDPPLRAMQAPRLEETYLGVLEDSVDVSLRLGRNVELVAELTELTAEHPLRERLCRQLMVALYRGGRPAEALGHYRRTRAKLIDELGMEPGSELRRLEQAILREDAVVDPALDPSPVDRPGRAHVPDTLPAAAATFVGRAAELDALRAHCTPEAMVAPIVCLVHGPGGSGKSALALRIAHEVAGTFPDGVLYVDLRGSTPGAAPLPPAEILRTLIRALGGSDVDPRQGAGDIARIFRTRLRGRRILVVLDNAASASQALPAIPDEPGCMAIVTSRNVINGPLDAVRVHLDAFDTADAVQLLGRIVGERRVADEPDSAAELATLCGRLPLALRLIATRAALRPHWPLRSWVELLADEHQRLDQLRHQDVDVRASFLVSLESLRAESTPQGRDALTLFRLLGLLDGGASTLGAASALTGWPAHRAEAALEHLLEAGLLFSPGPNRYAMYDLITLLAAEQASAIPVSERRQVLRHAVLRYLDAVDLCGELATGNPGLPGTRRILRTDPDAMPSLESYESAKSWLDGEIAMLVDLVRQACAAGVADLARPLTLLVRHLPWYFNSSMRWSERTTLAETVLAYAHRHRDPRLEGVGLAQLCVVEAQRGNAAEAERLGNRAAELLGEGPTETDPDGAHDRFALDMNRVPVYLMLGEQDTAVELCTRMLPQLESAGYSHLATATLSNLAMIYSRTGRLEEAPPLLRRSARINRELSNLPALAVVLNSLMEVHAELGDHHEVVRYSEEALAIHHRLGSEYLIAEASVILARSLHELGRAGQARERYRLAHELLDGISTREQIRLAHLLEQFAHLGSGQPTG